MKNINRKTKKTVRTPGSLLARLLAVHQIVLDTHIPFDAPRDL